jgi:hypothetical protein
MKHAMKWTGVALAVAAATIGVIAIGYWLFARQPIAATLNTGMGPVEADQIGQDQWDEYSIS